MKLGKSVAMIGKMRKINRFTIKAIRNGKIPLSIEKVLIALVREGVGVYRFRKRRVDHF
jgi:hypothetical protein